MKAARTILTLSAATLAFIAFVTTASANRLSSTTKASGPLGAHWNSWNRSVASSDAH